MYKTWKILCSAMLIIAVVILCTACSKDALEGIWYSDRLGCEETLILKEDGTFHYTGQSGIYLKDKTCLVLAGETVFGEEKLTIGEDKDGNLTFSYDIKNGEEIVEKITLFAENKIAEESKAEKKQKKEAKDEELLNQEIQAAKSKLLGTWLCKQGRTILTLEFREDGQVLAVESSKKNTDTIQMKYVIKDGATLTMAEMGKQVEKYFSITTKEGQTLLTINQVGNKMLTYVKQ